MKSGVKTAIIVSLISGVAGTITYYIIKLKLISAIIQKYGNVTWQHEQVSGNMTAVQTFQVAESTLERFNIFQLKSILQNGESSVVIWASLS